SHRPDTTPAKRCSRTTRHAWRTKEKAAKRPPLNLVLFNKSSVDQRHVSEAGRPQAASFMCGPQVSFTFDKPFLTKGFHDRKLIKGESL
ncbi:hypothetical protein ACCT03_31755, partial [Rhizobium johnstonii]|uniref:hypothetical protein n=1 Tax=Rhizobium johnstonii TaxID=3019933 RepID=UPI003F9A2AA0